jgi:hypothetical protein
MQLKQQPTPSQYQYTNSPASPQTSSPTTSSQTKISKCANVLPFGSGRKKYVKTKLNTQVPPKKKPAFTPQFHALGFNIYGVIVVLTIFTKWYEIRASNESAAEIDAFEAVVVGGAGAAFLFVLDGHDHECNGFVSVELDPFGTC